MQKPMTRGEIERRYPRLIRAMRWAACLTPGEAVCAIYLYQMGDDYSSEAVNHYGGNRAVIRDAFHGRATVRALRAMSLA